MGAVNKLKEAKTVEREIQLKEAEEAEAAKAAEAAAAAAAEEEAKAAEAEAAKAAAAAANKGDMSAVDVSQNSSSQYVTVTQESF